MRGGNVIESIGLLCDSCGGKVGGQTTRNKELIKYFSKRNIQVNVCDTCGLGRRKYFFLYRKINRFCRYNPKIIIVQNRYSKGYMWPLLKNMQHVYHNQFFEMVVGGVEAQYLLKYPRVIRAYKVIKRVYTETFLLTEQFQQIGIGNVVRMPTCIPVMPYKGAEIGFNFEQPLPICMLSRVCKEKGIETAMKAVRIANQIIGRQAYHLNIFGPIEDGYESEFEHWLNEYRQEVSYQGFLEEEKKTEKLHQHYLFLFPTEHKGEGFPAMLIDVFAAGLPVICSDINALPEIVEHGRLGFVVHRPYAEQVAGYLEEAYHNTEKIYEMRKEALKEAGKYDIDVVWQQLWSDIMEV